MAISLFPGDSPGGIIMADFIMLADVHAIMAAEAGDRAKAESNAAAINILI